MADQVAKTREKSEEREKRDVWPGEGEEGGRQNPRSSKAATEAAGVLVRRGWTWRGC